MRARIVVASVPVVLALFAGTASALDPLGAVEPTPEEQAAIYLLNRARSDPPAYGQKIGVDLSTVAARPPLAVNQNLTGSARFHAKEMLTAGYFDHTSAVTGDGPKVQLMFSTGLSYY